jgi:hypothetical protein
MMISWLLAGFDVLENPTQFELYSSRGARLPDPGQTAKPSGDSVRAAAHSKLHYFRFAEQRPASLLISPTAPWLKLDTVRNSALPSSIVQLRRQNSYITHSGPSWLNRMIGDFLAFQIVRERLSIERGLSSPCDSLFTGYPNADAQPFYLVGRANSKRNSASIPNAGSN